MFLYTSRRKIVSLIWIVLYFLSDFKKPLGPKGKAPWITDDDGKDYSDSQLIIEHLTKKHNIQMLKLTPEENAVARGLRAVVEDNMVSYTWWLSDLNWTLEKWDAIYFVSFLANRLKFVLVGQLNIFA